MSATPTDEVAELEHMTMVCTAMIDVINDIRADTIGLDAAAVIVNAGHVAVQAMKIGFLIRMARIDNPDVLAELPVTG